MKKPKKSKPKPRRVIIGTGEPVFEGARWVSLIGRDGTALFLRQSNLRGKWVRLVAEVLGR